MMECPWCGEQIEIDNGRCPACNKKLHIASETDFQSPQNEATDAETFSGMSVMEVIENSFKCSKCRGTDCSIKEVAMTGAGLSKLFDIQHNHYLFVSCLTCGFVEVFDPDVLQNQKTGRLGTVMDVLFGG
jgi:predicted nucleic-acid-binding Zn-ribbon protein